MANYKDAIETLEIFTEALGAEAVNIHTEWAEYRMISAHFELGELRGSATITSDFTPGFIRVSVWRKNEDNDEIVRVTAAASIALAAVNMAIAQHTLAAASE